MDLHNDTYLDSRKNTSFGSQVICDIERNVVKSKGQQIKNIIVKFNIPRNCKTFKTKSKFFVELHPYPRQKIAIPIKENRNYERFTDLLDNGWTCTTYGLESNDDIVAYLSKDDVKFKERPNMIGIDVNAKWFTASVITPKGKILKQMYFGKDIWAKRKKIFERREILQSLADKGSKRADISLERLKHKEKNFVKNRLGEVVRDITNMAIQYNADIAIEDLKRFKSLSRKANKKIMKIPFYQFKILLESRCFDKKIILNIVDSWHTSKWCTHCGAVGQGHSANYSIFKCKNCGQIVNSDRKASLAIAVKSLVERMFQDINQLVFQISTKRVSVNGLLRSNDGVVCAVHSLSTPKENHFL